MNFDHLPPINLAAHLTKITSALKSMLLKIINGLNEFKLRFPCSSSIN